MLATCMAMNPLEGENIIELRLGATKYCCMMRLNPRLLLFCCVRVFTLGLAEWLCKNYNKDATATKVVKDLHLWLMPSANPDGFDDKSRSNA